MNEILQAIEVIRAYYHNPENFKTRSNILQGILISNWMDSISTEFVDAYIRPKLNDQAKEIILDINAKA